ncbi:MAG TPA: hypothetical protein VFR12_08580 [Pyrinomonadaceae bacterium]|nr:hypothetical protein [Pyrinomonadaceae bacterium]
MFIGRMIGGTEKFRLWNNALEAGQVRFAVEEVFKGQAAAVFTVNVASLLNTSCAYGMQRGQRYLVYAIRSEYGLYTGGCTRTILMTQEGVDEDLKFLRNLPPPGVGGELTGVISADLNDSSTNPLSDWLFAKDRGEGKKQGEQVEAHSTSQKVSVTDNLKNLKIKLSRLGNFSGFCGEH